MKYLFATLFFFSGFCALAETDSEHRIVMFAAEGEKSTLLPLADGISVHLSDLDVSFEVIWFPTWKGDLQEQKALALEIESSRSASMVIWCDPAHLDRLLLYLPSEEIPFLERIIEPGKVGALAEVVGNIARGMVKALLVGEGIDAAPIVEEEPRIDEPPEPVDGQEEKKDTNPDEAFEPSTPQKASTEEGLLYLEGEYVCQALSSVHPALHGFGVFASVQLAKRITIFLGYTFFTAYVGERLGAKLELRRHPSYLGVGYHSSFGNLDLGAVIRFGVDVVTDRTAPVDSVVFENERSEVTALFSPMFRGTWWPFEMVGLLFLAGVEIPLNRIKYGFKVENEIITVVSNWTVQPVGYLGLVIKVL